LNAWPARANPTTTTLELIPNEEMQITPSGYGQTRTITAFFDNRTDAEEAVQRLHSAGIAREAVRLVPGSGEGREPMSTPTVTAELRGTTRAWGSGRLLRISSFQRRTGTLTLKV
jgi:hypothetical protein